MTVILLALEGVPAPPFGLGNFLRTRLNLLMRQRPEVDFEGTTT